MSKIRFDLAHDGQVKLEVYNVKGQKVETLLNQSLEAGYHSLIWNAIDQASGVYIIRYSAPDYHKVQRIMLLK